jgi:hypothetical protein
MPGIVPDYPTVMSGTENFSDGKIAVEVTLGMPGDFKPGKDGSKREGGSHSGRRGHGMRAGMTAGGAYQGGTDGMGDGPRDASAGDDDRPRATVMGSTLPPAQLKLHLRNTSTSDAVACEVVDFSSTLGNFAVFPSTYKLEAGQSAVSETMTSRLGVEGSEIPMTVAVRTNGQVEKKVILVRLLPGAEKPGDVPAK